MRIGARIALDDFIISGEIFMNKSIESFVKQLTYYEQINLLMSFYMSNDATLTRTEAYERAVIHWGDDNLVQKSIETMLSLGPTNR